MLQSSITSFQLNSNPDRTRIYGLDILRALAVLMVVNIHSIYILPPNFAAFITKYFMYDGVNLFFVLSGYLIGTMLIKLPIEQNDFKTNVRIVSNFLKRRWLRTLPNYYLMLIVICIYQLIFNPSFEIITVLKYIFFSQNLVSVHPDFFGEAWSLSVEEWFYLLFPSMLIISTSIFKTNHTKLIIPLTLAWILLIILFRFIKFDMQNAVDWSVWDGLFRKQVFTRLDSSMFGLLGAYISFYLPDLWRKIKIPCLLTGLCVLYYHRSYIYLPMYRSVFYFTVEAAGFALLLPWFSSLHHGKGMFYRFFTFISVISYSLYLVHYSFVQLSILPHLKNVQLGIWGNYFIYWILSVLLSTVLYTYIELPFMKMRTKIY